MAGHRARVAEAEVDVFVAVDVAETRAACFVGEDREAAGPPHHPRHGHPGEEAVIGLPRQLVRAGMLTLESSELALEQRGGRPLHRASQSKAASG